MRFILHLLLSSYIQGLSGLQNLQELSASHNSISSLKHLRALPSLIEVDVSHNQLTDLQGLQLIPTLQVFHAGNYSPLRNVISLEHNRISTLIIPQTFFTHLSKELDKGDSAKGERKTALRSSSSSSSASNASKAESRSEARSGRGRGGRVGKNVKDKEAKETVEDQKEVPNVPQVGLPSLLELYLSGNMITTLKGFDAYGTVCCIIVLSPV